MTRSRGRRLDAWYTVSHAVARHLAEGRGDEAIERLRREEERTRAVASADERRFLLSQIAYCQAHMGRREEVLRIGEEIEALGAGDAAACLHLAEFYHGLAADGERALAFARACLEALAREPAGDTGEEVELADRARTLAARVALDRGEVSRAFAHWSEASVPDWRVAMSLVEAGHAAEPVRRRLVEAIPLQERRERAEGATAVATADRMRRLADWLADRAAGADPGDPPAAGE